MIEFLEKCHEIKIVSNKNDILLWHDESNTLNYLYLLPYFCIFEICTVQYLHKIFSWRYFLYSFSALLWLFLFVIVDTDCLYVSSFAHFPQFKVKFLPQINLHFLLSYCDLGTPSTTLNGHLISLLHSHLHACNIYTHRFTQENLKHIKYYAWWCLTDEYL